MDGRKESTGNLEGSLSSRRLDVSTLEAALSEHIEQRARACSLPSTVVGTP
jgi:hypothetical protein